MDRHEEGAPHRQRTGHAVPTNVQSKLKHLKDRATGAIAAPPPAQRPRSVRPHERSVFLDPVSSSDESIEFFPIDDSVLPRFPITKSGYDRDAVDAYLTELEASLVQIKRERDTLKAQVVSKSDIAAEIERLGEQTSAILITAHTKANERVNQAEFDAQTRIADSSSYAAELREEALREHRRIESENRTLKAERERLLGEVQRTADALSEIASAGAGFAAPR